MTPRDLDEQLDRLASDHVGIYQDARRWFLEQGPSIASALVAGLDQKRLGSVAHWRILLLLRELALPETLPAILKAFREALTADNHIVLPGAMEALAVFDSEEAVAALLDALNAGDADTVNHAAALLADQPGKRVEDALAALLGHEDPRFRRSGVCALMKMGTESALDVLRQHQSRENDPGVLKQLEELTP